MSRFLASSIRTNETLDVHGILDDFKRKFADLLLTKNTEPNRGIDALEKYLLDGRFEKKLAGIFYEMSWPGCNTLLDCEEVWLDNKVILDYHVFMFINNINMYLEYLQRVKMDHHGSPFLSLLFNYKDDSRTSRYLNGEQKS